MQEQRELIDNKDKDSKIVQEFPSVNNVYAYRPSSWPMLWLVMVLLMAFNSLWQHQGGTEHRAAQPSDMVLICYYSTPDPQDTHALLPEHIHPKLCTHINIAFARVFNSTISLSPDQLQTLTNITKLKTDNPKLKILLSVGGSGASDGFSEMVVNHASRKVFIKSIKSILRQYSLDGIDLDWEFPAVHNNLMVRGKRERQHFSQLLREIKMEYIREKRDYLLSVAVAAQETIVNVAYDVDQLNLYADFVNIMTYDFHFYTKYTPFTGLNSPLYARPSEQLYMSTLNVNHTVNMFIAKGLDRNKIVVGVPTYGHTFALVNPDNSGIGSPASGFGAEGSHGFINYPDVCSFAEKQKNAVTVKFDVNARVPYLYKDVEWVSFDNPQSVSEKAEFIRNNLLRGAMIYSLNADDYMGVCKGIGDQMHFPLTNALKTNLLDSIVISI